MSQIMVSLRGRLRPPTLASGGPSTGYTHARLLASLYELHEGDKVRLINQPVEIAELDLLEPTRGHPGGGDSGDDGPDDGPDNVLPSKGFDCLAEFKGLLSTAVEHPLLAATVAKRGSKSDLCLGVRVVLEQLAATGEEGYALEVAAFGGVIIDTQGVALGSEVHATVLMFECAPGRRYHDSLLRKVLEGEGERLIAAGALRQCAREEHMEVSFASSTSSRRLDSDLAATGHSSPVNNSVICVSRSLVNTWDRAARNTVVVSVEAVSADDGAAVEERAIDITARLVSGHDTVIVSSLCDAVGESSTAEDEIALPRMWLPFPAGESLSGCWRHSFFTAPEILSKLGGTEGLYIVLSVGHGRDDIEIMLREGCIGFDRYIFSSSPSMTFEHAGVRFGVTVRLLSSELPVSSTLATVVSCGALRAGNSVTEGQADTGQILSALSNDNIMASDFSEVEPFAVQLLNGAFNLIRVHTKDSDICMRAGTMAMRILASADACGGHLAHVIGTYVARLFMIPDIGIKLLYVVAVAVGSQGAGGTLGLTPVPSKTGGMHTIVKEWPLKISGPDSGKYVLEHAWAVMVQLAFRSHRISLATSSRKYGAAVEELRRPASSSQLLMEGLSKMLKAVAHWTARNLVGNARQPQDCAARAMVRLRDIVSTVLEHQPDASAVLMPLESFLEGLLPASPAGHSDYPPPVAVKEIMKGIRKCFAVPAVKQNIQSPNSHPLSLAALFVTLVGAVHGTLSRYADVHDDVSATAASSKLVGIVESMTTLRQAINMMKVCSIMWWDRGPTRQTDLLIDLLTKLSSCVGMIGIDKDFLESAGLLVCAASEVFKRASWEKLRLDCEKQDTSGAHFVCISNLFYGSLNSYCRARLPSPEPTVGPSLVDLIHVLFDATTCAALYRRAALKLVPRCHMILRRSNGSNLNVQAGLTTEVIETLPASCAALLMQHSNSLAGSFSSSSHALRISFEVAWIEALVPLLGDVDVFVNETAAKCLEHRLVILSSIVSDASEHASAKSMVATILGTLPRRVAKRLHAMCSSLPSLSMASRTSSSWDCLSTASAWWFKPRQLHSHVVKVGAILNDYMDRVAQLCLLYAQLWDTNPEVSTMVPLCGLKQDALPVLMSLCHELTNIGLYREAASCLSAASRSHSLGSCHTHREIQDISKWEAQSSSFATGMCLASAASLLRTTGSSIEAFWCMLNALNVFLYANDIQRATYSFTLMTEWLGDMRDTQSTMGGALKEAQRSLSGARARARGDGFDRMQRIVPWYFLVNFRGAGFSAGEEYHESNATFIYVLYNEAVESGASSDALVARAKEVALTLKAALSLKYFVFDGSNNGIAVSPAIRLDGPDEEGIVQSHTWPERFVSMDETATEDEICVFIAACQSIPLLRRVPVEPHFQRERLSQAEKLILFTREMEKRPCLPQSWSCLDWCNRLCRQEPLSYSVEYSIGANSVKGNASRAMSQTSGVKKSMNAASKFKATATATTNDMAAGMKKSPTKRKSKLKSRTVKVKTNAKVKVETRAAAPKHQSYSGDASSLPGPPVAPSNPKPNLETKLVIEPQSASIPSAGDVPAWMLGMQESLQSASNGPTPGAPPSQEIPKKTAEAKKAMAYARSLGAFMAPEDAQHLMIGVEQESKVVVECVVTTDKGSKDAVAEITPDHVYIYYATKGMFGGSKKKTMYKFEMHKRLSVQEAPTPKLMMLMAPELNGEMLYVNCDKRGMFKGAVVAFQKKLKAIVAQSGDGGDDGWGPSAW